MRITTPENDIQSVLFTREQIEARVRELGAELAEEYRGKQPLMVCILKVRRYSIPTFAGQWTAGCLWTS